MHRSFYRIFFIGAVLCRHYQEPLQLRSEVTDEDVLDSLTKDKPWSNLPKIEELNVQYLERFPVYKMMEYAGLEDVFGPLVLWLKNQDVSRLRSDRSNNLTKVMPKSKAVAELDLDSLNLLQETIYLLQAFEFLVENPPAIWNDRLRHRTDDFKAKRAKLLRASGNKYRKLVPVVMMDYYQLGEMFMLPPAEHEPDDSNESDESNESDFYGEEEDEEESWLGLQPVLQKKGRYSYPEKRVAPSQNIAELLEALYKRGSRPNHCNGERATPLNMQFFSFTLRKNFNLRFADDFFSTSDSCFDPKEVGGYAWLGQRFLDPFCRIDTVKSVDLVSADDRPVTTYVEIK